MPAKRKAPKRKPREYKTYRIGTRNKALVELARKWKQTRVTIPELAYVTGVSTSCLRTLLDAPRRDGKKRKLNRDSFHSTVLAVDEALNLWLSGKTVIGGNVVKFKPRRTA